LGSLHALVPERARPDRPDDESTDLVALIRGELFRLRARPEDVGPLDGITVGDRGDWTAALTGSSRRSPDFFFRGPQTSILDRLRGLPDDGGPEVVRSEFGRGH
jgi:hypothetical protein